MPIDITADLEKAIREGLDLKRLKKREMDFVARAIIFEMKQNISKGISPITGKRFPAYKNPARYPGDQKPQRPVNLYLTGDFLDNLAYKIELGTKPKVLIGFWDQESILKEKGHREGANTQPKRPIIPIGGETFSKRLLRQFDLAVTQALKDALG
jgi:hypothetical protein